MFDVKKNLRADMDAARLLNISDEGLRDSLDRVSRSEINAIDNGIFKPYQVSFEVKRAMRENAEAINRNNPFDQAGDVINDLRLQFSELNLNLPEFPVFENPLMPIMQDTPITPTSLNLPGVNAESVAAQVQGGNFSGLTNRQKFDLLFPNG